MTSVATSNYTGSCVKSTFCTITGNATDSTDYVNGDNLTTTYTQFNNKQFWGWWEWELQGK